MPKAKAKLTPEEQKRRFQDEVRKRIAAGELSHIEAEAALDNLLRRAAKKPSG